MNLRLRIMLSALRASRWRAAFALGATAVAIAAVMIVLALETGARRELEATADRVGRNLFVVNPARIALAPGRGDGWTLSTALRREDVSAIHARVANVRAVLPVLEGSRTVKLAGREATTTVRGVTPGFVDARNFRIAGGRMLEAEDERARVAVAGPFLAARLNDGVSLVGESLTVGGVPFEIVGQLEPKGISDGQNEDDQLLVPLETARRRVFNAEWLSRLLVQVEEPWQIAPAQREVRTVLRDTHGLGEGVRDDFETLSLLRIDEVRRMNRMFLSGLAGLFAAITLGVGGTGVLAVMWMNARDRTWEIGLRMAVGARRRDVTGLFLGEAVLLTAGGGVVGVAAGGLAVAVLKLAVGWQMAVDARGVVVPLAVSFVLGLLFGVVPAARASSVDPTRALRDRG